MNQYESRIDAVRCVEPHQDKFNKQCAAPSPHMPEVKDCHAQPSQPGSPHPTPAAAPLPPPPGDFGVAKSAAGGELRDTQHRCQHETIRDYIEVLAESQLRRLEYPYERDPHMSSIVSYPQRCTLWGDGGFHGNCDGSLFKELVQLYQPRSVADPMMGSGTTRDVIAGLNRHFQLGIRYWGSDLEQGFNFICQPLPERFDFIWVHPPYWNVVRYSAQPADLSSFDSYDDFRRALRAGLVNCFHHLQPRGRLAVLVGDVRRAGRYIPIVRDLLNWENDLGELRSIIIKAQHNCRSDTKKYRPMADVRIQHEYCVVFQRSASISVDPLGVEPPLSEEGRR